MKIKSDNFRKDLHYRLSKTSMYKKLLIKIERFIETEKNIFFLIVASIFIGETSIMLLLRYLPTFSDWTEALMDSSILSILIFPVIYIFLYLPLKKSMAAHKLKEANYSYVIENIGEGVGIADTNERFVFANAATEKIFGVGKGELNGVRLDKFFTKESFDFILAQTKERLAGRATEYEGEIVLKNGTKKNILITAAPQFENDTVIGTFAIFRDITKIKKAEETIKYERNLLRTIIDNLPDAVYVKDIKCRKIITNPTDVKNQGMESEKDVIGKTDYDLFPKETADAFFADDQHVLQTGQAVLNREESFTDAENQQHWLLTSKVPIKNEKGEVTGLVGVGRDITKQKIAEERSKYERNLLRALIDNIPDAVYVKDTKCRKVIANPVEVKYMGFKSEEEVLGKDDYDVYPKEIADSSYADDQYVFQTGLPQLNKEDFFIDNLQQQHWMLNSKVPIKNEMGEIVGLVGIGRDISKRKNLEIELIAAKEKAESGSKAKSEFLANMSHEIRTPLNSVIGFSDLLHKTKLDDIQRQYVSAVFNSANSLLDIINEILDFSKIEAGKLEIENEKTDIFELGYQVADVISYQAYKKDLELLLNIALDVPRFIWTDAVRIRQVLINLLGNAVKFTATGEVELKIEILQKDVDGKSIFRFSVRDTGIGINPENQQKIFEAFSQEDASINRKFGGTGLGLAISRRLISLMGSELKLESTPQVGSTFYFDLKLRAMDGEAIEWKNLYEYKKVLIVDDNVNNRRILKDMLALKLINCDEVENGMEACNKLESGNKYDLVLMDYHMPVMDGITAIEKIRNELKLELPIMLLHSSADDASINTACQELNVHQRLVKPIKIEHLFESLSKVGISNNQRKIKLKEIDIKQPAHLKEYKVLVVDDNMFNILLIKTIITQILPNAQISEASNGNEAVELYRSVQPDIIFMDIQMPEMNGYDAAKIIRSIEKLNRIPIIALTAGTLKDEKERCLEAGMNDYVSKPFVSSTIVSAIDKWLVSTFEKSFVI